MTAQAATRSSLTAYKAAQADPWYFGLGIGKSALDNNKPALISGFPEATTTSTFNHDDFSFNLVGGYRLDRKLTLELGLSELGSTIATTGTSTNKLFNIYTIYINAVKQHHFNENAILYGKLGAHFWSLDTTTNNQQINGTDIMAGAGIDFTIDKSAERLFRVEWLHFVFDEVYLNTADTLTFNLILNHSL